MLELPQLPVITDVTPSYMKLSAVGVFFRRLQYECGYR